MPPLTEAKPTDNAPIAPPKTVAGQTAALPSGRLHQPFKEAVLLDAPDNELLENVTCTGKNVAQLYETIAGKDNQGGLWDQIRFTDDAGKLLNYQIVFTTAAGEIALELYPQDAPNHCRNMIALAEGRLLRWPAVLPQRQVEGRRTAGRLYRVG